MKKISIPFVLILFFSLISISGQEIPELSAEKATFSLGTIREGINVPVSFKVFNRGTKDVRIQHIRTFAACIETRPLAKHTLSPGDSLTLEYIFVSLGYGGASVDKQIEIHYNNKKLSPLKLYVRGNVLPLESFQAPIGEMTYNFFVLVDIRQPDSYIKEHIIGAINVPQNILFEWAEKAAKSISEELVIYIFSEGGHESDTAAKILREKGYSQYISIVGGLKEWKNQMGRKFLISGKS